MLLEGQTFIELLYKCYRNQRLTMCFLSFEWRIDERPKVLLGFAMTTSYQY